MTAALIVTAAGSGTRLGASIPKALVELGGVSILARALDGALAMGLFGVVVVTAPADELEAVSAIAGDRAVVVAGGDTRQVSVAAGLAALPVGVDVVLVHDAARPLTPPEVFERVVDAVRSGHRAVVPVVPVTDTIKRVGAADVSGAEPVEATVDRAPLRAVQTPQGFERGLLDAAHGAGRGGSATDDAGLVEALGEPVWAVPGSERSLKITTVWDLAIAESLLGPGFSGR